MRKNSVVVMVLAAILISPVFADIQQSETMPEEISRQIPEQSVLNKESSSLQKSKIGNNYAYKKPVSKRKIAKKFLLAMGGVAVSSLLLYILLTLYNKIRASVSGQDIPSEEENSLTTPYTMEDDVKSFLDKTKY